MPVALIVPSLHRIRNASGIQREETEARAQAVSSTARHSCAGTHMHGHPCTALQRVVSLHQQGLSLPTPASCQPCPLQTARGAVLLQQRCRQKINGIWLENKSGMGRQFVNLHAVNISWEQVCHSMWGKETSAGRTS